MPSNLEQQRKRAKELLRAHRRGDAEAAARVQRHLPRAAGLAADQVLGLALKLADARLVVAREAGFASWPRLVRHLDGAMGLAAAVSAGDAAAVRAALARRPPPWQAREALEVAVERDDAEAARLLLAYGAWPDRAGRRWGRWGGCLHSALLLGRGVGLMEVLLAGGASVTARDAQGRTPLAIAVRTDRADAADLLRRHGAGDAEVSEIDRLLGACVRGERPAAPATRLVRSDHQHLCWAVRTGHVASLPALLALGLDPDIPDDDGETALHLAVAARSLPALEALLRARPRPDARNYRNQTPLSLALAVPDADLGDALAARLRHAGARQERGQPPELSAPFEAAADAVVAGDLDRLAALLDRHPELIAARSTREHRATLLHYVAANGVEDVRQVSPPNAAAVAELLLRRGADANALAYTYGGGPGQTALYLAVTSVHPEAAGIMADLVAALVRGGAKVNGLDDDRAPIVGARRSALPALAAAGAHVDLVSAAALGRLEEVKRRLAPDGTLPPGAKLGADVSRPDQEVKDQALLQACAIGHVELVQYLLAAGARVDARGSEGMTPLHRAAWGCHLDAVRLLLMHGASLEARNDYGGTVLDFVVWVVRNQWQEGRDYPALIETLIAAGADPGAVDGVPTGRAEVDRVFRRG
jgi:ankyrin repeat protein